MKPKKNRGSNLEHLRFPLFLLGVVVSTSIVLMAFEWRSYDRDDEGILHYGIDFNDMDEVIPVAPLKAPPKPPSTFKPALNGEEVFRDILNADEMVQTNTAGEDFMISEIPLADEYYEEEPIILEDEQASFPGGIDSLNVYLADNLRYPSSARQNGVKGTVFIEFVVSETGEVQSPRVLRGLGFGCDQVAIDLVEKMPDWNPARFNGKRVPVTFRLPVRFTLQ